MNIASTSEGKIYHLSAAAKLGNQVALEMVLNLLFCEANSLQRANPQKALAIYQQAKKANPGIKLDKEDLILSIMQMSVAPGPFNWRSFCKKYNLQPHVPQTVETEYHVWYLAEEVSQGGTFW